MSFSNLNPKPGKVNTEARVKDVAGVSVSKFDIVKESNKGTSRGGSDGQSLNKLGA